MACYIKLYKTVIATFPLELSVELFYPKSPVIQVRDVLRHGRRHARHLLHLRLPQRQRRRQRCCRQRRGHRSVEGLSVTYF